ncbi:receptor-like protein 34, partial [Vigna umbellata]|uniref:receptor-like protein 34 n=1 Tax=Vigna umbellata TaxID=87088 RepID=UPI001F5F2313
TQIQGKLPSNILHLPNLQEIDLSQNENLRGELPTSNWTIPLRVLSLFDTAFSGYLSYSIAYLKSLHTLDLSGCNFDGFLPPSLSNLTQLSLLDLSYNQLKGSIPQSLARCTTLEVLDLGNNNIEDLFPYSLETLPNLQVLSLRSNKFHGIITSSDTKLPFPKLRIFDISYNYFTGILPVSYVHNFQGMVNVNDNQTGLKYLDKKIFTIFTIIDLSNNMFEGEIPKAIGDLHYLQGLNLSHNKIIGIIPLSLGSLNNLYWLDLSWNQLTGEIPMSLGNLSNLELLDLSWNQLKGEIPMSLSNLSYLQFLDLSWNQFEGVIPTCTQFATFSNDSYAGNLKLCGIPLSNACNEDNKRLPNSTLGKEKSRFGWKPVVTGYVCGMIYGIALAYNAFFIRKPQWLIRLVNVVLNVKLIKTNNRNRVTR